MAHVEQPSDSSDIHVWIIVNAEDPDGQDIADVISKLVGPHDRLLVLGNQWNATRKDGVVHEGRVTSMWIPFGSISFAERHHHTPMDLYDRSHINFDRKKQGVLAYQQHGCRGFREDMFTLLDHALRNASQMPGSALS